MATVFVTQETRHDFRQAEAFGKLIFMSVNQSDDFHNIVNSEHNRRLMRHLRHIVKQYNPDEDFIILTGSPYVRAAVTWILGMLKFKQIKFLRWDNQTNTYVPLVLTYDTGD